MKLANAIVMIGLMVIGDFYLWSIKDGQTTGFLIDINLKVLFPTWLLYFSIAYFIGTYYRKISELLNKKWFVLLTIILFLLSIVLVKYNFDNGIRSIHSRRIDLVPYVIMFTILLIYIGKKIPHLFIVRYISKYAFGIYLSHWLIQQIIGPYFAEFSNIYLQVGGLFLATLIVSIAFLNIMLMIPYSKFLVGNIKLEPSLMHLIRKPKSVN